MISITPTIPEGFQASASCPKPARDLPSGAQEFSLEGDGYIRIATRSTPLALSQTNLIKESLLQLFPNLSIEVIPMSTSGDRWLNQSLAKIGGKGAFVKELEEALLEKRADIAVHSIKDIPAELPSGLILAVVTQRGAVHDVLISNHPGRFKDLPSNAIIGTSSLRRAAQIKALRSDLNIYPLRGSVNSRLKKLKDGLCDAIVLAYAGLERLQMDIPIAEHYDPNEFIPAIGQGALGIECRADDEVILSYIQKLEHASTRFCITAERALSAQLGGHCHMPLAGYAKLNAEKQLELRAFLGSPEGTPMYYAHVIAPVTQAEAVGQHAAEILLRQGGAEILNALKPA